MSFLELNSSLGFGTDNQNTNTFIKGTIKLLKKSDISDSNDEITIVEQEGINKNKKPCKHNAYKVLYFLTVEKMGFEPTTS